MNLRIRAKGHGNVLALHETTLMFTKENYLTPRGDCIIAVSADKACASLPAEMKEKLKRADTKLEITIECAGVSEKVTARGHPNLTLTHPHDMVIRKSDYTCERTLAVHADKAACDLNRKLIEKIEEGREVRVTLNVSTVPSSAK